MGWVSSFLGPVAPPWHFQCLQSGRWSFEVVIVEKGFYVHHFQLWKKMKPRLEGSAVLLHPSQTFLPALAVGRIWAWLAEGERVQKSGWLKRRATDSGRKWYSLCFWGAWGWYLLWWQAEPGLFPSELCQDSESKSGKQIWERQTH